MENEFNGQGQNPAMNSGPSSGPQDVDKSVFYELAENSPNMIFVNVKGKVKYANKRCMEVMGYTREEFYSDQFNFMDITAEEFKPTVQAAFQKHSQNMEVPPYEYCVITKSGKRIQTILTSKLMNYNGEPAIMGIITDISQQKNNEKAMRESEQRYRSTIDSLADAIHVVDKNLKIVLINESFKRMNKLLGLSTDIVGLTVFEAFPFLPTRVRDEYLRVFKTGKVLITEEESIVSGKKIFTETRKIPLFENEKVVRIITSIVNITERKLFEIHQQELNRELALSNKKLKQLALRDAHTGLYNHRFLSEALDPAFALALRNRYPFSLIMIDIDYFKSINDVYGHLFGDIVLKQFADMIRKQVRRYNTVIRYGGEEFIVLSPNTDRLMAVKFAQRLLDEIGVTPFGNKKNSIKLKVSIAVASYPDDTINRPMDLIELAERILDKAKEFGGNQVFSSENVKKGRKNHKNKKEAKMDIHYLKEKMERLNKRANQSLIEAIFAFAKTIEMKDHYTGEHVEMTVYFASQIAEKAGLTKEEIHHIKQAAILHDLGKVGISEKILLKPGELTQDEFKTIMEHPVIGADIIRPIHLLHNIIPLVMYHHERWDGKGYPMGLKGEEIPIGARVIALADAYQALTSTRPYRKAFSKAEAIRIIKKESGTRFDPKIVKVFLTLSKHLKVPGEGKKQHKKKPAVQKKAPARTRKK